jgi:Crinkler effector protein N-terminal domain
MNAKCTATLTKTRVKESVSVACCVENNEPTCQRWLPCERQDVAQIFLRRGQAKGKVQQRVGMCFGIQNTAEGRAEQHALQSKRIQNTLVRVNKDKYHLCTISSLCNTNNVTGMPSDASAFHPADQMKLYCWVMGDEVNQLFPLNIAYNKDIGGLKKAIKNEQPQFNHLSANALTLWKVSIPAQELDARLPNFQPKHDPNNGVYQLSPMDGLSEIFALEPLHKHLHIIVQPPGE